MAVLADDVRHCQQQSAPTIEVDATRVQLSAFLFTLDMAGTRTLPDEVLTLICEELGQQRDFLALFRCAQSSVSLAEPALRTLYRLHEQSSAFTQSDDLDAQRQRRETTFATRNAERDLLYRKWLCLWRSIILSSLDQTYKPYCRYLRMLDFRNLSLLFEDLKFATASRSFFAGGLEEFYHSKQVVYGRHEKSKPKKRTFQSIDIFPTLNAIGEAVTQKTTLLEELAGHFSQKFLPQWTARSPRLHSLVLWEGNALGNGVEDAIRENCPSFRNLTIHQWSDSDADQVFAKFTRGLLPDSLGYFQMISFSNIARLSLSAFNQHARSLTELHLGSLHNDAILALGELKDCTALRTLVLGDIQGSLALEATQNDVFEDIVDWLSACSDLKDLTLKKFYDGPSILAKVLSSPNVYLTKLSVEGYVVRRHGSAAFHSSLTEQPTLQSVWLKGDGEGVLPNDLDIMIDALCRLQNLRELILKDVSDEFDESHIIRLALELPLLEDFWTSGGEVSSDILPCLGNMKYLKNLTLYALTKFSAQDIVTFVSQLDAQTQRGFNLSLMAGDMDHDLEEEEQTFIRDLLKEKLDGRFDFVLWREAELSASDSD